MTAVALIVRSTARRLLRRNRVLGLTVLTAAPAPILLLVSWGQDDLDVLEVYQGLTVTLGMILVFPIASIVVCTAALGEERKGHTMPFLVLKPVSRFVISASVTVAAAVASFVVLAIGVVSTWIVAVGYTGEWSLLWPAIVSIGIQSIASAALFVPIGLLISRATLVGLAYLFIWESILASVVAGFGASSMFRITISAYADLAGLTPDVFESVSEILGNVLPGAMGAFAKVVVLVAISIVLTGHHPSISRPRRGVAAVDMLALCGALWKETPTERPQQNVDG